MKLNDCELFLLNYGNENPTPGTTLAVVEERFTRDPCGRLADSLVPRLRILVFSVVRTSPADVGSRARKNLNDQIVYSRLDFRHDLLFRNVLVADVCTDNIRWISMAARVFSDVGRDRYRRDISGDLCSVIGDLSAEIWVTGLSCRAVCVGFYGISAVLGNGE